MDQWWFLERVNVHHVGWTNLGIYQMLTIVSGHRPLGSSMFTPGVPEVMREFGSTNALLGSFVVSIYILGYAFGRESPAPKHDEHADTPQLYSLHRYQRSMAEITSTMQPMSSSSSSR